MIKEILMPILGLDELGWQVMLGGLYAALLHNAIFFGGLGILYWLFGRKAIEQFRNWLDEQIIRK